MAIYIEIKRIDTKDGIYYYQVSTEDFRIDKPFYISIDSLKMCMNVYEDQQYQKKRCSIDLQKPSLCECDFIMPELSARILASVKRALARGKLEDFISYQA